MRQDFVIDPQKNARADCSKISVKLENDLRVPGSLIPGQWYNAASLRKNRE